MSEKKSSSSPKKKKQVFNPFRRIGGYTAPLPAQGSAPLPQNAFPAEFIDSSITFSPVLPKTEATIRIQFRCTVNLSPGDALTLHLPGFKGPKPRVFSLETLSHPDGLNTARCFAAYWSGDTKPRKVKGVVGAPQKQTITLRCLRKIEESTLITFAVPIALGLVTPEKLAVNSAKIKLEGNTVRQAEGGKIPKQTFLSCTGLKKTPVVDELEIYEQAIAGVVEAGGLGKEDRFVAEEVTLEDVEQMLLAVTTTVMTPSTSSLQLPCRQRPYPISMPWPIAQRVFHAYEDAGPFVKNVMENAVVFIKKHDPLAVHREVAANWGVKVGAVVILEDMLATQYAAMYPGIHRNALLAAHLLTMEPADVARTFPVTTLPKFSIQHELTGAFRMQATLSATDPTGSACGIPSRCETTLKKWSALLSVLLTAAMPASAGSGTGPSVAVADGEDGEGGGAGHVRFAVSNGSASALPQLTTPPPLFTGLRDVPAEELQHVRELQEGDWYVFPSLTVAQQNSPVPSLTVAASAEQSAAFRAEATGGSGSGSAGTRGGAAADAAEEGNEGDGDASAIPDNAILFEIRQTVEALELADISLYPFNRQWLLPFSSSFRVVSVTTRDELNDLTHVVLDMVGSLTGEVADTENLPEGDRTVARMLVRKLCIEQENNDSKLPLIARLAYLTVRRNDRRRLHPPTLMRAQYLSHFQEVKRASEAKKTIEEGTVMWQVRVHAAQMLEEGVVKPAVWEPLHRKYAPMVEQLFLSRTRSRFMLEESGIVVDLSKFTADYGGKGVRPIRRLVERKVTHEPGLEEGVAVYDETKEMIKVLSAQIASLNTKLGLTPSGQPLNGPSGGGSGNGTGNARGGSGDPAARGKKKPAAAEAPVKAA